MRTIKFVIAALLTISVFSCEKNNDEETVPKLELTAFETLLDDYDLLTNDVKYEYSTLGTDTNLIYFNGRIKDKLVIKGFNKLNKELVYSNEGIKLDTIINIDEGYGVITKHYISDFTIQHIYKYSDECTFILWGWAYGSQYTQTGKQAVSADLYMISGQNIIRKESATIPTTNYYFNTITPWFENSFIAETYNYNDKASKNYYYSMNSDKPYELTKSFWGNDYIPINFQECICFDNGFERRNIKTYETLWNTDNPVSDLPENTRIDKITYHINSTNSVICKFEYTHYDGITGERKFNINPTTGVFTEIE
ncbi:hypothetical protein [Carboxylicivirga sp. RSCT41]|uniref:hypothetical protein n=1 Tax=Carboxylicivirga agarovorans TaxID=3417570 RepID=UPI003D327391